MFKLGILLILLLNATLAFSQSLVPSLGFSEITIGIGASYTYPYPVLYFFPKKEGLDLTLENGFLTIRNPLGLSDTNIEIIRQDASADYIKILNKTRLNALIKKENRLNNKLRSEKSVSIRYNKSLSNTSLNRNGKYVGQLLLNRNQFFFKNKINKDNTFSFNFWDQSTEFYNDEQLYRKFYNLKYQYKNVFYEHGYLVGNPRSGGINRGGYLWLNRVGYQDANWYIAATEGSNREVVEDNDQVYGFNLAYSNLSNFSFGSYIFSNEEKQIQNPSVEGQFRLDKFTFNGQLTFNQDKLNDKSSMNYRYSISYQPNSELVRNMFYTQYIIQNGVYDPTYGAVSDTSIDLKTVGTTIGLMKRKKKDPSRQDMTLNLNYSNVTTDATYAQMGSVGYLWTISQLKFGLRYMYSQNESLYTDNETTSSVLNPSISFSLMPSGSSRQRYITVSDYISENSSGLSTNVLRLSYIDKSNVDKYQIFITKRKQEQEENNINNDFLSLGASASYRLSTKWQYGVTGSTIFSNTNSTRNVDISTPENADSSYDLTNYGYSANVTYKPNREHTFSVSGGQNYVNRFGFNTRATSGVFSYTFNYLGDWKTPLNYIVNNRSLKLHFFEDRNFNGKLDKNEKLISGLTVKIQNDIGNIERKVTDSDGYVRFSGLAKSTYQVLLDDNRSQVSDSHRLFNLEDNSVTTEVGIGSVRNVVFQVFDSNLGASVVGNFYYDIKCPSVGYSKKVSSAGLTSLKVSIPHVDGCVVSLDPTQFNQYFNEIDLEEKLITSSSEILFNIRQVNKIDVVVYLDINKDGTLSSDERFNGKDIFVEYKNKKHFSENGVISVLINEKDKKETIVLDRILNISPKYDCKYKKEMFGFKEKFFQRFSVELRCSYK